MLNIGAQQIDETLGYSWRDWEVSDFCPFVEDAGHLSCCLFNMSIDSKSTKRVVYHFNSKSTIGVLCYHFNDFPVWEKNLEWQCSEALRKVSCLRGGAKANDGGSEVCSFVSKGCPTQNILQTERLPGRQRYAIEIWKHRSKALPLGVWPGGVLLLVTSSNSRKGEGAAACQCLGCKTTNLCHILPPQRGTTFRFLGAWKTTEIHCTTC